MDWGVSEAAAGSAHKAATYTKLLLDTYSVDIVVSEEMGSASTRRGSRALSLMEAVERAIQGPGRVQHITRPRLQPFATKYVMAAELGKKYPVLADLVPDKPPIWLPEARNVLIFEALALAEQTGEDAS